MELLIFLSGQKHVLQRNAEKSVKGTSHSTIPPSPNILFEGLNGKALKADMMDKPHVFRKQTRYFNLLLKSNRHCNFIQWVKYDLILPEKLCQNALL